MVDRCRALPLTLILSGLLSGVSTLASAAEPASPASVPLSPLLSPEEYQKTVYDIFGADLVITGRFEPEQRLEGLLAVGARSAAVSADGMELYDNLARGIAAQVVEPKRRKTLFRCAPQNAKQHDDACARSFFASTGRFLFRRPLAESELAPRVKMAGEIADSKGDFYTGISAVLSQMLLAPEFLYQMKTAEPDPANPGQYRLDSYSRASVLSFYLWGAAPDDVLLKAAEKGELMTPEGLRRQVDRMTSSPAIEGGVRAFFADMLGFDEFDTLSKDVTFFPEFTPTAAGQAREQTLRTVVNHVVNEGRDYRDLFTTPKTFLTRPLAAVYGVPLLDPADNAQPDRWIPFSYQPGDPRAGILAQMSFVALHSPSGRSSPTLRGKALRENLMCQTVPPPPANVDFKFVTDTSNPVYKTTRDRLTAHRSEAMCAGCHKITDPIGLALENFNSAGAFRTTENGAEIDTTGELGGVKFDGPAGLAKAVHDDPAITSCVAKRSFAFAAGRAPGDDDGWRKIETQFKDSGYNVIELMRQVALSPLLYTVPAESVK